MNLAIRNFAFAPLRLGLIWLLALQTFTWQADGQILVLADGPFQAGIDLNRSAGMFFWNFYGRNQLNQDWFWYRIGNNPEVPIDTISVPTFVVFSEAALSITYSNAQFGVEVVYSLTGSQNNVNFCVLQKTIIITSTTTNTLDFHLFNYVDMDSGGSSRDSLELRTDLRGRFDVAHQQNVSGFAGVDAVVIPSADHAQGSVYGQILASLSDSSPTTLTDYSSLIGPVNSTWAFQWDLTLSPTNSVYISEDMTAYLIPLTPYLYLAPISNRVAHVGVPLIFTNTASGGLPPPLFHFASAAPAGASVNLTNGVFRWTPTASQGGTTNRIALFVTEYYIPDVSTQSFNVVVAEDLELSLGEAVASAGDTALIPLTFFCTAGLTNLSATLEVPPDRLANLSFTQLPPQVGAATATQLSPVNWLLSLTPAPGQTFERTQLVAQLSLEVLPAQSSAFIGLSLRDISALRNNGTAVNDVNSRPGRLTIVGHEPLLEAARSPTPSITLYANPGARCAFQFRTNLAAGDWIEFTNFTVTNRQTTLPANLPSTPAVYYRARTF